MDDARIKEILTDLINQLANMLNNPDLDVGQKIRVSQALTTAINTYIRMREEFPEEDELDIAKILSKLDKKYQRVVLEAVKEAKTYVKRPGDIELDRLLFVIEERVKDILQGGDVDSNLAEIVFMIYSFWLGRRLKPGKIIQEWVADRYG